MKNFTLTCITLLISVCGFAQLAEEGFEGTWPPAGWGIYDNGIGLTVTWEHTNPLNTNFPPYAGSYAAFVNRENVPDDGPAAQDWLVTKQFTAPTNPQLRFYSRLTFPNNQGGLYKVLISTDPVQANLAAYELVQQWIELQINPTQDEYREIVVNLPAGIEGQPIYVAFVMEADFKDRWLIDNVKVVERCLEPENLSASGVTETTANLEWDNPSGLNSWEIEIVESTAAPTGTGELYTGTLPYVATNLTVNTSYKYYVKAVCPSSESEWVGPFNFNTGNPGQNCLVPKIVTALPYTTSDNTFFYGVDYYGNAGTSCAGNPFDENFGGSDVVYQFTPATDMVATISVTGMSAGYSGVYVYTSCDNIGTECFAADVNQDFPEALTTGQINAVAGQDYYIVIATATGSESTTYTLTIEEVLCPYPSSLQVSGVTTNSASISWVEFGDADSWEYVLQPAGTGAPTGSGTSTTSTTYNPSGLALSTAYEFYVRAVCGVGEFSQWVGPLQFNTLCDPFDVPFTEGFNSDSVSENCWNTLSVTGVQTWNLDGDFDTFEGDEVAVFDPEFQENEDWLISPAINLTANQRLRFNYNVQGFWGSGSTFKILMSTTGIDPEDFTTEILPSDTYNGGDFTEKEIFLDDIPAGTVFFAWVVEGGNGTLRIDNVRIDDIPPCPPPSALTAENFTQTTAELSWAPGFSETSWEVVVQPSGTGIPTGAGVTATNPYIAPGLDPNTEYEYYVRATCGGTDGDSEWVGPFVFRTACEAFDVPFFEGFNSDSPSEHCWTINNVNGGYDEWMLADANNPFEGDETARFSGEFSSSNDDWLITPAINLAANHRLTYQYKLYQAMYPITMEVRLSTTGTNPSDFTEVLIPAQTYTNELWIKAVANLSAYTGTVYIAWHAPGGSEGMYFFLDDVHIEAIPECADPHNLQVSNITQATAELSWTPGNGESQWEVVIQQVGSGQPTASGIITSNNPYTATGLLSGAVYEYYIRSVCGEATSMWNGPYPFVTLIANDECADAVVVPVNPGIECIETRTATITGATFSPQTPYCEVTPTDDVWFEFVATSTKHNVSVYNTSGFSTVHFALYLGDCANPELILCNNYDMSVTFEYLVVGQTYKIRVFTGSLDGTTTFELCVRTPLPHIITDDTTYTVEELVTEVLVGAQCAQISNITYSTGTAFLDENGNPNPNGIAYFNKNGSAFPMSEGILLTTGNAMSVPGPESGTLSDGTPEWTGDADLDAIVLAETGVPMNSTNATILEFDFVPLIDNLSFDFLFASEEYGIFQCDFSDTFAFLLTDSSGNTTNLALVPGTSQPVSVVTIRDDQYNEGCSSVNAEYFDVYTQGIDTPLAAIDFQGYTKTMTAQAIVEPNTQYHIKMVIADRGGEYEDTRWDSGVFLAAGSFSIGNANLGADLTVADGTAICVNETYTIASGMSPDIFTFKWFKDDVEIPGETGSTLTVTTQGVYRLEAVVTGQDCLAVDSILIEFYPAVEDITNAPSDMEVCSLTGTSTFDLSQNNATIIGTQDPADFMITYHTSEADAQSGANPVASPYESTQSVQAIYARIVYAPTGCYGIHSFSLIATPAPSFTVTPNQVICEGSSATLAVTPAEGTDMSGATYVWVLNGVALPETTGSITANSEGEYVVTVTLGNCVISSTINVDTVTAPVIESPADVTACTSYELPVLSSGTYFTESGGTGTELAAGTLITASQTIYVFEELGTCSAEESFNVDIVSMPDIALTGECQGDNYVVEVRFLDQVYNDSNVTIEWKNSAGIIIGSDTSVTVPGEDTYTVIVSPTGAECPTEKSIVVDKVICNIQKGISPGDGSKNENFDLSDLNVKKLTIFNRYGQEVYSFSNYTDQWHGQDKKGNELPSGTYYYSFERENGDAKTGWIYVNRRN